MEMNSKLLHLLNEICFRTIFITKCLKIVCTTKIVIAIGITYNLMSQHLTLNKVTYTCTQFIVVACFKH